VINRSKAWITRGGWPTSMHCSREATRLLGSVVLLIPEELAGLSLGKPEEKMGLAAVPTTSAF